MQNIEKFSFCTMKGNMFSHIMYRSAHLRVLVCLGFFLGMNNETMKHQIPEKKQ
jgi:hypothetical protein